VRFASGLLYLSQPTLAVGRGMSCVSNSRVEIYFASRDYGGMKDMARTARRIHIPTLDPKFIQERNPDRNWLIERFNEHISLLDRLADSLPKSAPSHQDC
jgi:hypothetical protein